MVEQWHFLLQWTNAKLLVSDIFSINVPKCLKIDLFLIYFFIYSRNNTVAIFGSVCIYDSKETVTVSDAYNKKAPAMKQN